MNLTIGSAMRPRVERLRRHRGFTLLELLIVLAVLAMLLAILVPSLRSARAEAKRVVCKAKLSETAKAWNMFLVNENSGDGYFLKGAHAHWNYGGKQGRGDRHFGRVSKNTQNPWPCDASYDPEKCTPPVPKPLNRSLNLEEIVCEAEAYHCPADIGGNRIAPTHYDYYGTSYATNVMLVGPDRLNTLNSDPCKRLKQSVNGYLRTLRYDKVDQPGEVILIGDASWLNASDWAVPWSKSFDWHGARRKHNVAFFDGHVDFLTIRKGLYVTNEVNRYRLVPFKDLIDDAIVCQKEVVDE